MTAVTDYYTWHQGILQLISGYLLSSTGPLCLGVFIFFMFIMFRNVGCREVLMGVGDGVASVIMLTFTKRPGPHADFYKEARPPC